MKKNSQHLLSENLCEFIKKSVYYKGANIERFEADYCMYLPTSLAIEVFKNQIIENNFRIAEITRFKQINRIEKYPERPSNEEISELVLNFHGAEIYENYKNVDVSNSELLNLKQFDWWNDKIENLPTISTLIDFNLMIEYFARVGHYNITLIIYKDIEKGKYYIFEEMQKEQNQLQTKLNDTQRSKLFDLLVLHGFIPDKDKEGFIWAFGGVNDNYTSYSTDWLKKDNLVVYLVDCLCYDKNVRIQDSYLNRAGKIFGIKNPNQMKRNYKDNSNELPNGHELIDKIISEAQK